MEFVAASNLILIATDSIDSHIILALTIFCFLSLNNTNISIALYLQVLIDCVFINISVNFVVPVFSYSFSN